MRHTFQHGSDVVTVDLAPEGGHYRAEVEGRASVVAAHYLDDDTLVLEIDGRRYTVHLARQGRERFVAVQGEVYHFVPETQDGGHELASIADPEVRAPMPGKVLEVLVGAGTRFEAGDGLLILEAMKMENRLTAPADGVVEEVRVEAGQMVDGRQVLLLLRYD